MYDTKILMNFIHTPCFQLGIIVDPKKLKMILLNELPTGTPLGFLDCFNHFSYFFNFCNFYGN
jgi:hypothetical protein